MIARQLRIGVAGDSCATWRFLCNCAYVRGCTFSLARKYQRAPGGAKLSLFRCAPGPPYPPWGSGPIWVAPPYLTIRHCRSVSWSCLNSVPHWNFRLLHPPLAAQPSVPRGGAQFRYGRLDGYGNLSRGIGSRSVRGFVVLCGRGGGLGGVCGVRAIADRPYRGAQESSLIRVAARPYSRRDPCSETAWLGIPERDS